MLPGPDPAPPDRKVVQKNTFLPPGKVLQAESGAFPDNRYCLFQRFGLKIAWIGKEEELDMTVLPQEYLFFKKKSF